MGETEAILKIDFHLRKPYNEAKSLIACFNQIIEEGGRAEITLSAFSKEGYVLNIKLFRCRNTYAAACLGAKIIDKLEKQDFMNITKFNFSSTFYCPVSFEVIDSDDNKNHGPIIEVKLFEHQNKELQDNLYKHFELIEMSMQ